MPLLSVENLKVYFHTRDGVIRAVDGLSYALEAGVTLGIVGESGSGKSVAHYALMGLLPVPPARIESGNAHFGGLDLLHCSRAELRKIRGKRVSMIFQDPMTALNPYMKIGKQLMEPLRLHEGLGKADARARAMDELRAVGIQDPEQRMNMYPHEFSGGMRQRVMIAMALITRPELLIADEPTTALDVTVQAQILELIKTRQQELGMAVVLITHDLGVVAGVCDRVLVMYAGRILEAAPTRDLFSNPKHPYTRALMNSLPSTQVKSAMLHTIPGLPPDPGKITPGCPFAPRCEYAGDDCRKESVELNNVAAQHESACVRVQRGEL